MGHSDLEFCLLKTRSLSLSVPSINFLAHNATLLHKPAHNGADCNHGSAKQKCQECDTSSQCKVASLLLNSPMHVFCWQIQQPNHNAAPKLGIKLGLIINDMHKALGEVEFHMEVWEVGRNAATQALQCHFIHFVAFASAVHYCFSQLMR